MKNKLWITGGIILGIAALAFALYKPFLTWLHNRQAASLTTQTMEGLKIKPGAATFPLKKGVTGSEVLYWQAYLNQFKGATIETLDGIWGNETERENNDHYTKNSVSASEYAALVIVNYMKLTAYLYGKGAISM